VRIQPETDRDPDGCKQEKPHEVGPPPTPVMILKNQQMEFHGQALASVMNNSSKVIGAETKACAPHCWIKSPDCSPRSTSTRR
jgi:hypothetical protein